VGEIFRINVAQTVVAAKFLRPQNSDKFGKTGWRFGDMRKLKFQQTPRVGRV